MGNKIKLVIISEKVMPYRCALYKELASHSEIDLKVFFLDKWGVEERFDPTMGTKYSWGENILDDIPHEFIDNRSRFKITYTGADRTPLESKLRFIGGFLYYLRTYFSIFTPILFKKIKSCDCDVVIVENYSSISSVLGTIAAKYSGKKVFLRGEATLRKGVPLTVRILKQIYLRMIFKLYSGFMYSCKANKDYYLHYGANKYKMTFVPSAVDSSHFKPNFEKDFRTVIRKELCIEQNDVLIIGVGRLVKRKNWEEAIEGCSRAAKLHKNLTFLLVGDGPEKGVLEKYAESICCPIKFTGFKDQQSIVRYYQAADIIIQTSRYDPSPKVLNEALGFGLPIIVSDTVGTAGDVCIHEKNGFIYQIGNINSLAEYIDILAKSQELRKQFGLASEDLSQVWSISTCVNNILFAINSN